MRRALRDDAQQEFPERLFDEIGPRIEAHAKTGPGGGDAGA
jgi:hypothetical protein